MPGTRYEQQSRYETPMRQGEVPIAPRVQTQRAVATEQAVSELEPAKIEGYAVLEPVKERATEARVEPEVVRASEMASRTESWRSERATEAIAVGEMPGRLQESAGREPEEARGREAAPLLVPVRASVFDDDFFRGRPREAAATEEASSGRGWDSRDTFTQRSVQPDAGRAEVFRVLVPAEETTARGQSSAIADVGSPDRDELDIPAFLRRGN